MIDLSPPHLAIVERILAEHVPDCEVRAFGSRAIWNAKDYSDLDLAIIGADVLPRGTVARLKEAFEESRLPMRVDVVDWHAIADGFREAIDSDCVLVQQGTLPRVKDEWREMSLGEVVELKRGYDLPKRDRSPGPVPLVSSSGITDHHGEAKVKGPGVVTGRYGTLGQVFFVRDDFWPLNTTLYVRDFKGNDPRFISYFLRTLDFSAYSDKAAVPGLNRNHLHQEIVRLPPLEEQRTIARVLGALDDRIELNRRMSETLEEMARALFRSWFVDFDPVRAKAEGRPSGLPPDLDALFPASFEASELGEIPAGWEVKTLGDLSHKPQYGYTQSAQDDPVGPKFLRITDINKGAWVAWDSVPYCEITPEDYEKYRLHEGDVLIARMADPGHGCVVEGEPEAVFASYLIRFSPRDRRFGRFLQYWLRSDGYWQLVRERGAGTTRLSLNAKVLSGFPLVVPPDALLESFRETVDDLRSRVVTNTSESSTLAAQRDALLPRLVSGETRLEPTAGHQDGVARCP